MAKPIACKFCKTDKAVVVKCEEIVGGHGYKVNCRTCGCQADVQRVRQSAIAKWNRLHG